MNEKKNIQDLCAIISETSGVSKKNSEAFLRTLFDLVEEALEKDGIAKVPGLGTFKTTTVEERKSVNVRTGEEIIIPSYKKVNFTPSKELKEKVNQPFSHLVPFYTLKKEGPVDPPEEEDDTEIVEENDSTSSDFTSDMATPQIVSTQEEDSNMEETTIPLATSFEKEADDLSEDAKEEHNEIEGNIESTEESSPQTSEVLTPPISTTGEEESSDLTEKTTFNNTTEMEDFKKDSNEMEEQNASEAHEEMQNSEIQQSEIQSSEIGSEEVYQEEPNYANEASADEDGVIENSETPNAEIPSEEDVTNEEDVSHQEENAPSATEEEGENDQEEETKESSEEKAQPEEKVIEDEKKSSKKWLLWIFILLILALAALFAAKYFIEKNAEEKSAEGQTFTEEPAAIPNDTLPTSTTAEDTYFKEDTAASTDDFVTDEPAEPIDCYTEPEKCTTEIEGSDPKEIKDGHSFDPKLVEFMQQNYPELNFPAFVPVKETYTVKDGNRLAQISRNIYDNEYIFWGYIYAFNTDQLNSPNDIKTGMVLKVPDLGSDFIDPYSSKCKKIAAEVNKFLQ